MATRFINLKPDKRMRTISWPSAVFFLFSVVLTFLLLDKTHSTLALISIPFWGGLSLFLFQGKSPIYWIRFFIYYTTESRLISNHVDSAGQISISEIGEYKKAQNSKKK